MCGQYGLSCNGYHCPDYKVRFLCPCKSQSLHLAEFCSATLILPVSTECFRKVTVDADLGTKQMLSLTIDRGGNCLWEIHVPHGSVIRLKFLSDQNVTGTLKLWDLKLRPDGSILSSSVRWWYTSNPYFVSQTNVLGLQTPTNNGNTSISALEFECELHSGTDRSFRIDRGNDSCFVYFL